MRETFEPGTKKSELLPGLAQKMLLEANEHAVGARGGPEQQANWLSAENVLPAALSSGLGVFASAPGRLGLLGKGAAAALAVGLGVDSYYHQDHAAANGVYLAALGGSFLLGRGYRGGFSSLSTEKRLVGSGFSEIATKSAVSGIESRAALSGSSTAVELKYLETRRMSMVTAAESGTGTFANYGEYRLNVWRFPSQEVNVYEAGAATRVIYPNMPADYSRISLSETRQLLAELPDRGLVRELRVLDHAHPDQLWHRVQTGNPNLKIAAETLPNGRIDFFRPVQGAELRNTAVHEWSHLHRMKDPSGARAFDEALKIEPLKSPSASQITSLEEPWPILSESLLSKDPLTASAAAVANPLKTRVWAASLESRLTQLKPDERSVLHADYMKRLDFLKELSSGSAAERLAKNSSQSAAEVRRYLGI